MGNFFTGIFGSIFGWIATYFTKKVASGLVVSASLIAATGIFYTAAHALLSNLGGLITEEWLLVGFYGVLPDNAVTCLTVCFSAEIFGFLYREKIKLIRAIGNSST